MESTIKEFINHARALATKMWLQSITLSASWSSFALLLHSHATSALQIQSIQISPEMAEFRQLVEELEPRWSHN